MSTDNNLDNLTSSEDAVLEEDVITNLSTEDVTPAAAPVTAVDVNAKIQNIEVRFNKVLKDIKGRVMPKGTATATFSDGRTIIVTVTGGANVRTYGITDPVKNHPVTRIEGGGYKNHKGQPMPYSVFYNGGEALHVGRLDMISHGCVHVADVDRMRRMNQACVRGKTKVSVIYEAGILNKVMKQIL